MEQITEQSAEQDVQAWRLDLIRKEPSLAKELTGMILDAESAPLSNSDDALAWITDSAIPRLYECLITIEMILVRISKADKLVRWQDKARKKDGDVCSVWVYLCVWTELASGMTIGYCASQLRLLYLKLLKERAQREKLAETASTQSLEATSAAKL